MDCTAWMIRLTVGDVQLKLAPRRGYEQGPGQLRTGTQRIVDDGVDSLVARLAELDAARTQHPFGREASLFQHADRRDVVGESGNAKSRSSPSSAKACRVKSAAPRSRCRGPSSSRPASNRLPLNSVRRRCRVRSQARRLPRPRPRWRSSSAGLPCWRREKRLGVLRRVGMGKPVAQVLRDVQVVGVIGDDRASPSATAAACSAHPQDDFTLHPSSLHLSNLTSESALSIRP